MKRQLVYYSIALLMLIAFVIYAVFVFGKGEDASAIVESRSNTLAEFKDKMVNDLGTLHLKDYFEIQQVDYSMNEREVSHRLVMKNITGKDLKCNYQVYKEDELIDRYISGLKPAIQYGSEGFLIEMNTRAVVNFASGYLMPYDTYSEQDLEKIKTLASKLYVEIEIDGKYAYLELDVNHVDQIIND